MKYSIYEHKEAVNFWKKHKNNKKREKVLDILKNTVMIMIKMNDDKIRTYYELNAD